MAADITVAVIWEAVLPVTAIVFTEDKITQEFAARML